jgi:hypothetical protein
MAGSKRNMVYRTDIPDSGSSYKVIVLSLDESNAKLFGGEEATPGNLSGKEFAAPGQDYLRLVPRYALLEGKTTAGRIVRRRIIVPDPENTLFVSGGTTVLAVFVAANTIESVTFDITGVVGEARTLVRGFDSGLDDGTTT